MLKDSTLIPILITYRIVCGLATRNYDYPDEHWQGPQIAHNLYYGYGYMTWQWIISQPLRNPLYPYLLSLSYPILQSLHLSKFVVYGPKFIIQLMLAVAADYYLLRILRHVYGTVTLGMVIFIFSNWYYASCLSRTYSNSFQTCLTIIALFFWICNSRQGSTNRNDLLNRAIVTISYISRPTSIMLWAFLWPYQLLQIIKIHGVFSSRTLKFVLKNIINLVVMVLLSMMLGSIYYGKLTLTEWNFIKYNFIQKWSHLYGQEHFLFYFGISVPFMMHVGLAFLFLSVINLYKNNQKYQNKANSKIIILIHMICLSYLLISSLSTHKQHRFILPILPFLLVCAANSLRQEGISLFKIKINVKLVYFVMGVYVLVNFCLFFMFSFYGKSDHQAWTYVNDRINTQKLKDDQVTVIVLGQSHFMTGYTSLHRNITYRTPNSSAILMSKNSSQIKLLEQNPQKLLKMLTQNTRRIPDFIIAQGKYQKYTQKILKQKQYTRKISWRYCTIPEQIFIEYDSINIYQKQNT